MISKIMDWDTKADGIKEFMLQQLRISIDDFVLDPPKKLSGPEWKAAKLAKALRDIEYHEREIAAEIARTEARNRWLADLRASLPIEATP
jgi:hypothetical protein